MYRALFDDQGRRITSYVVGLHANIPAEAVEISDADQALYCTGQYIRDKLTGRPVSAPGPTATESALIKKVAINAERDRREAASPFTYNGHDFDYDTKSRERLHAAVQAAMSASASGSPINTVVATWTLYDNSALPMTISDFLGFSIAEAQRSGAIHETARQLKADVDAALAAGATAAQIAAMPVWAE